MIFTIGLILLIFGIAYMFLLAAWYERRRDRPPLWDGPTKFWLIAPGFASVGLGVGFMLLSLATLTWRYLP